MKNLILIALLFAFISDCKAQDKTSDSLRSASMRAILKMMHDSGYATYSTGTILLREPPKIDTIKCIMLVCDTFYYSNYTPHLHGASYFDKAGELTWVIGYCYNTDNLRIYWQYLDADKKPLPKNIIVWLSKQIEK